MTASIPTLINGHDAIARSARLLLAVIADEGTLTTRAPGRLASLATTVAMFEAQECGFVYAAANGNAATVSLGAESDGLDRDWTAYVDAWPRERIAHEAETFRLESRTILSRLLERVCHRNSCLYPHALAANALTPI